MNIAVARMQPLVKGDDNGPGVVRMISGVLIDLSNPKPDQLLIDDIAWSLAKIIRYNGNIPYDYTVARHSLIMSHYVPPEYAMEALLHDSGEAYCGDIIKPLKRLYPALEDFEDNITGLIMANFNDSKQVFAKRSSNHLYEKSDVIEHADTLIYQHECHRFGRPGQYVAGMHNAERQAMKENGLMSLYHTGLAGDRDAFLNRFYQLRGES